MRFVLIAAALAVLTLPAHAADGDPRAKAADTPAAARAEDAKKDAVAASGGDRKKDARPAPSGGGDDLVTCKRDADGMRGPERSTFMTRCLKERR